MKTKTYKIISYVLTALICLTGFFSLVNIAYNVSGNAIAPNTPTSGQILRGNVEFSCDSNSADSVELRIDGILIGTMAENANTWTYTINTSGWDDGAHIIRYDSNGDTTNDVMSIPVKFDNNGPLISNGSTIYPQGQNNAKPGDQVAITAKVTEAVSDIAWVTCDASPIGGGNNITMYDDGQHQDDAPNDDIWGTSPINISSGGGYKAAYVKAGDTMGNKRNVTVPCNIDIYEPTILEIQTILPAGQEAVKNADQVRITAKALDYKIIIEEVVSRKPLDVVLALDNSGSMAADNGSGGMMWDDLEYAATTFIDQLVDDDRCAVFGFDLQAGFPVEDVKMYSPFLTMSDTYNDPQGAAYTSTGKNVTKFVITEDDNAHLTNFFGRPACNTPIWDTIGMAMQYAINNRRADAVPVVIAMTDGDDTVGQNGREEGSETFCPGASDGAVGQTWTVNGGCEWGSPVRTYPSVQRETDTNPNNPLTTVNFDPGADERTRTGLINSSIPVFTIGLGITPQASDHLVPGYLSANEASYKYTTEFDLSSIGNTSNGGKYYYAPESTDLFAIYTNVSQIIQTFGTDVLGLEQPKGIASVQGDLSSVGIPLKVNMFDDGLHSDGKAGDKVYGSDLVTINSLDTGNIVFQVEGTDEAGNVNGTQYNIQLDNLQPNVAWVNTTYPPGRDVAQDQYSIYVESNCSDGQTGLGNVYLDASNIGGSDQVPMKDDGSGNDQVAFDGIYTSENVTVATGLISGIYTYTVNSYDRAGNKGSQSGNIEIYNDVDIILENIAEGDILTGNYQLITNITDPDGIPDEADNPRYRIDANQWIDMTLISGSRFQAVINTSNYLDGEHTLYVHGEDIYGAQSTYETTVIFDNSPPEQCSIVAPVVSEFTDGVYSFKITANDNIGMEHVNITILNETGAEMVSNVSVGYNADSGYYELSYNTANLPDGAFNITAYATDGSGHTTPSVKTEFYIDNNEPSMSILHPQDGDIISGRLEFNISIDEVFLTKLEYKIDSSGWTNSNLSWDTWLYSDGQHTIKIRAVDGGGHQVEETIIVTVDNNVPTSTLSLPTDQQFISGIYTFGALVNDNVGLDRVWIVAEDNITNISILNTTMSYNANTGYYETFLDTNQVQDGNYTARVFAMDAAGNITVSANVTFMIDNNAPEITINQPDDMDIVWGSVSFGIGIRGEPFLHILQYNIDSKGWVNITVPWNTTLVSDGEHSVDIRARDRSGKESTVEITVIVDNNLPFGDVLSPNNNEYISGKYSFKVSGGDTVGIQSVRINVFSNSYNATYNPLTNTYEVGIDTTLQQDGTYFITAQVIDLANRAVIIGGQQFNVDNHIPEININSPGEMDYVEGIVDFNVEVHDHFTSLTQCEYNIDNKGWIPLVWDPGNSTLSYDNYIGPWNTSRFSDGVHTIDIRGSDMSGLERTYTISVIVDNSAPTCEIHTPIQNQHMEDTITFKIKATDKVGLDRVILYFQEEYINASYNSQSGYYEYTFDTTTIAEDGTKSVRATAYDLSGKFVNTGITTFNIDNTPPKLGINSPSNLQFVNGTVIINATTTDTYPLPTEYNVDSSGWHDVGFPWDTTKIQDGTHTIIFRARDSIGHETVESIEVIVDNNAPSCTIHTPTPSQFVEKSITFKVLASDNLGIDTVLFNIFTDTQYEKTIEGTYNSVTNYYEYTQSLYGIEDGTYSMNAEVTDISLKKVVLDSVNFHIDQSFPVLNIQKPLNGEHLSGISYFNLSSEDSFDVKIEFNIDEGGWETYGNTRGNTWDTTQYKDGEHEVKIRVTDNAGHVTEREINVFIDNSAPIIKFVTPRNGDYLTGIITVKVYSQDSVSLENTFMVIDNGTQEEVFINQITGLFESPLDTELYPDGAHTITLVSRDRVGNSNTATLQVRFKNAGPGFITTDLPEKDSGDIEFRINNTDNATKMYINIDSSGWREMAYRSSDNTFWYIWNTDTGDNGLHTYQIKAVDAYGNERISSDTIEVNNEITFMKKFTNILPLILFIMLILFLIILIFLLIRSGKVRKWVAKDDKEEEEEVKEEEEESGLVSGIWENVGDEDDDDLEMKGKSKEIEDENLDYECPDCGTAVGDNDTVCPKCGAEFMEDDEEGVNMEEKKFSIYEEDDGAGKEEKGEKKNKVGKTSPGDDKTKGKGKKKGSRGSKKKGDSKGKNKNKGKGKGRGKGTDRKRGGKNEEKKKEIEDEPWIEDDGADWVDDGEENGELGGWIDE